MKMPIKAFAGSTLSMIENETFGYIVNQIAGIQIYITTGIISVVLFKFFMMLVDSYKNNK